jgi:hypothetical protein
MLFEQAYLWLVFLASVDIMFTWLILARAGVEVNPVASMVIDAWGMPGAVVFKFALVTVAIVICEEVGRTKPKVGQTLAWCGPAINGVPVLWSAALIGWHWQLFAL